jgi:hypothetical protein
LHFSFFFHGFDGIWVLWRSLLFFIILVIAFHSYLFHDSLIRLIKNGFGIFYGRPLCQCLFFGSIGFGFGLLALYFGSKFVIMGCHLYGSEIGRIVGRNRLCPKVSILQGIGRGQSFARIPFEHLFEQIQGHVGN